MLLIFTIFSATISLGQSDMEARGDTRIDYFEAVAYGDLNRDGMPNMVTSSAAVGVIRYWEYDGGSFKGTPLGFTMGSITKGLATADMDQDGYLDIVLGANNQKVVIAYNHTGTYADTQIDTSTSGVGGLSVEDLDYDGDLDIIIGDNAGNIRVVENQTGTYVGSDVTSISSNTITSLRTADMNLDGKVDAVIGTSTGGVFISNGDGTVSLGSPSSIGSASGGIVCLELTDVERDGDVDIITGDNSGEVALFKNNRGSYSKSVISSYSNAVGDIELSDIDYDGDMDIFASSDTTLYYIKNSRTSFPSSAYTTEDKKISIIGCGDWDMDGDADVFIGTTSLGPGMIWRTTSIQEVGDLIPNPLQACPANALCVDCLDIDKDGLGDALIGDANNGVYTYINDGDGTYTRNNIDNRATDVISIRGGDVDQDGDMDIVVGEDSNIVSLHTNNGGSFSGQDLSTLAGKPLDIRLADYNNDGLLDVLVATDQGDLDALKNTGGGFTKVTLGSAVAPVAFNCLAVGDVDMDGDPDVAIGDAANNLRFFNNSGTDSFSGSIIGNLLTGVSSINLGDTDSDGDLDIVAGCESNKIFITEYKRNGFMAPSSVANATSAIRGLYLHDFNHDNRLDIITGDTNKEITLHTNRGISFENRILSVIKDTINDICTFDINADGGLDVMSVNTSGGVTEHSLSYIPLPFVEKIELVNGHGSGDVCYAGYDSAYRFKVNVTNPDGYLGVDYVIFTIDPGGLDLEYKWINDAGAVNPFSVQNDPNQYTKLMSDRPDEMFDSSKNWALHFELQFNWNFPTNDPLGVEATVYNKQGLFGSLSVGDVFWVESALVCVGTPQPYYQNQPLSEGGWVAGGGNVTWKDMKVAYKYNNNHAPSDNYTLVIRGEDSPKKEFTVRYGLPIDVKSDIADVTSNNEIFNISFKNMPPSFEDRSFEFSIKIDNNPPPTPQNVVVHRSFTELSKTIFDNDGKVYVTWDPVVDAESGTTGYKYSFESTGSGIFAANASVNVSTDGVGTLNVYIWAVDKVGNEGGSDYNSIFIDRGPPVLVDYFPNATVNTSDLKVDCGIEIKDEGGSGLDYSSIKYAYSTTGLTGFTEWKTVDINQTGSSETLEVTVEVPFGDLDRNYIKWSASDLAGNEWTSESWFVELNMISDPVLPVELKAREIGNTHIKLWWTPSNIDDFMKYDVYMGHTEDFQPTSGNLKITINQQDITEYNVTGLSASTTYYFIVRVYNSDNVHKDSNTLNVTTSTQNGNGHQPDDQDGLDDEWEMDYFGNLDQGPEDDFDGDGYTNLEEFEGGWDPTDAMDPPSDDDVNDDDEDDDIAKTLDQYKFFIVAFLIVFILVIIIILVLSKKGDKKKEEDESRAYDVDEAGYADQYEEAPYEEETPIYTATHHTPSTKRTKAVTSPRTHTLPKSKAREKTLPTSKRKTLPPASEEMVYEYAEEEAFYEEEMEPDMDIDDEIDALDMEEEETPELEEEPPEMEDVEEDDGGIDWEADEEEEDMDLLSWDEDE
jgi:hypothetical protein